MLFVFSLFYSRKKPPLEVVLWKPPGDFVKDFVLPIMSEKSAKSVPNTNTDIVLDTSSVSERREEKYVG